MVASYDKEVPLVIIIGGILNLWEGGSNLGYPGRLYFLFSKNWYRIPALIIGILWIMKRKMLINVTTLILLVSTVICVITGIIKWPGLLTTLGFTYRQVPIALITDLHDWSGILMAVCALFHVIQFKARMKRIIRSPVS